MTQRRGDPPGPQGPCPRVGHTGSVEPFSPDVRVNMGEKVLLPPVRPPPCRVGQTTS